MRGGYYRPLFHHALEAALDAEGKLVGWRHRLVGREPHSGQGSAHGVQRQARGVAGVEFHLGELWHRLEQPRELAPLAAQVQHALRQIGREGVFQGEVGKRAGVEVRGLEARPHVRLLDGLGRVVEAHGIVGGQRGHGGTQSEGAGLAEQVADQGAGG